MNSFFLHFFLLKEGNFHGIFHHCKGNEDENNNHSAATKNRQLLPTIGFNFFLFLGEVDDFLSLPSGCYFHPRCLYSDEKCRENYPPLVEKNVEKKNSQFAACWYSEKIKN